MLKRKASSRSPAASSRPSAPPRSRRSAQRPKRFPGSRSQTARRLFAPVAAETVEALRGLPADLRERWLARYGDDAAAVKACAAPDEVQTIGHTGAAWAELRFACRSEEVAHLDDLLLRRTRLGLLLRNGAEELLPKVGAIAREELGWSDARWGAEVADYRGLIARCYAIPKPGT